MTANVMVAVMTMVSLPIGLARADMVATKQMIVAEPVDQPAGKTILETRERVRAFLARDDVRAEMMALGVSAAEAEARVAALTEAELVFLAGQLDQVPAGEGVGEIIGLVTIIFFVIFGIAVVLDALGLINLFPFVCGPSECAGGQQSLAQVQPSAAPPANQSYGHDQATPPAAYRSEPYQAQSRVQQQSAYQTDPYPQPLPEPAGRNYYEERYGTQRQIR
ncbi:MAG: PA2779 family protein [Geminicoccaceae bacterium]